MNTAQYQNACCTCDCRKVTVHAAHKDALIPSGWAGVYLIGADGARIDHSDLDCDGLAAVDLVTSFERRFPVDAEIVFHVRATPNTLSWHWGWRVFDADGNEETFWTGDDDLALEISATTEWYIVVALFYEFAPPDGNWLPYPRCSEQYDYPARVEVLLPSSLDFSVCDDHALYPFGCWITSDPLIGPLLRSAAVFARQGPASFVAKCYQSNRKYNYYLATSLGGRGALTRGGASAAEYRLANAAGVCARILIATGWVAGYDGKWHPVASCVVTLHFYDSAVIVDQQGSTRKVLSWMRFSSGKALAAPLSGDQIAAILGNIPEHQSPACAGNLYPCVSTTDGGQIDTYGPPVAPNQLYPSGGSLLQLLGGSGIGAFSKFYGGGYTAPNLYSPPAPAFFGCAEYGGYDPFWINFLYPNGPPSFANRPDYDVNISVQPTLVTSNGSDVCECVSPDLDIDYDAARYHPDGKRTTTLYSNVTIPREACGLVCTKFLNTPYHGNSVEHTVECFPLRVKLNLPQLLNHSAWLPSAYCANGGSYGNLMGSGIAHRHPAMTKSTYVGQGDCSRMTGGTGTGELYNLFGAVVDNANAGLAIHVDYTLTHGGGSCSGIYLIRLSAGYINMAVSPDPVDLVRFFTAMSVAPALRDTQGQNFGTGPNYYAAVNIGPEARVSDYTPEQFVTWCQIDNAFGWQHDWVFRRGAWNQWHIGGNCYGADCPPPPATPTLSQCRCDYSIDPNSYEISKLKKLTNVPIEAICVPCPTPAELLGYFVLCNSNRDNIAFPGWELEPTFDPRSEASCAPGAEFLRYDFQ